MVFSFFYQIGSYFRRTSLVNQLSWLFGSAVFVSFTLGAFALYGVLVHNLNRNDIKSAHRQIDLLSHLLRQDPAELIPLQQLVNLNTTSTQKKYFARVLAPTGTIRYQSPEMASLFPSSLFIIPSPKAKYSHPYFITTPDYQHYVLISSAVYLDKSRPYLIQLAYNPFRHGPELKKYRILLALILLLALIICPLIAYFLTKHGLRPLLALTKAIEAIPINTLHIPLKIKDSAAEINTLVDSFNHFRKKLEQVFQALQQFSADLAHEVRTPLHNIINQIEVTLSQPRQTEEYQHTLLSVLEEAFALSQLIDRLLFLARAEQPNMALDKTRFELKSLLEKLKDFFSPALEEAHIKLVLIGEADFWGDALLLQRALSNLIANAIKYSPPASTITIEIVQSEERIQILITDQGPGIEKIHQDRIFDRFYRIEFARSKQTGGHGLGLAIVKKIVELHHGHIQVDSEGSKGTTFILTFPTSKD